MDKRPQRPTKDTTLDAFCRLSGVGYSYFRTFATHNRVLACISASSIRRYNHIWSSLCVAVSCRYNLPTQERRSSWSGEQNKQKEKLLVKRGEQNDDPMHEIARLPRRAVCMAIDMVVRVINSSVLVVWDSRVVAVERVQLDLSSAPYVRVRARLADRPSYFGHGRQSYSLARYDLRWPHFIVALSWYIIFHS
jgi:hypothetical protein